MDNVVNLNVKQKVHGPLQQALKTAKVAVKAHQRRREAAYQRIWSAAFEAAFHVALQQTDDDIGPRLQLERQVMLELLELGAGFIEGAAAVRAGFVSWQEFAAARGLTDDDDSARGGGVAGVAA